MVAAKYLAFSQLLQLGQWGGSLRSNKIRVNAAGRGEIPTHVAAYCPSHIQAQLSDTHYHGQPG